MNASSLPASGHLFDDRLLQPNLRLRVGEHVVDVGALRVVTRPEHPRLTSKAAAVLIELVRHAGDTVARDALLDRVWADRVTTPDVLTQAIKELRRAFGDDARPSRYIETIPKVGYRLLATVSLLDAEPVAVGAKPAGNDPELEAAATPPTAAARSRSVATRAWVAISAFVVVAIALVALRWAGEVPRGRTLWRAGEVTAVTSDPGTERRPAVSPDGTRIAYSQFDPASGTGGVDRLVLRAPGQPRAVRVTQKSELFEEMPTWSPDGSQIAFERIGTDACTVYTVSSLGGVERQVGACTAPHIVNYFDWTPDARQLITAEATSASGMALVLWDLATGKRRPLDYTRTPDAQDLEAHYSPDGRYIAFRRGLAPFSDLCIVPAAGGSVRQLTELHSRIRGLAWTSDSSGLVFASNHDGRFGLYAVDIASGRIEALGVAPAEYPSVARNSKLVSFEIPRAKNRLAWVALGVDNATPELLAQSTGSDDSPAFSPDGNRIAFVSDRSGAQQLWLYDFTTLAAMPLTDVRDALLIHPTWSADGRRILVTARGRDAPGLVEIDLATRRLRTVGGKRDILSGIYGPDPDSFLIVVGGNSRQNQLVLLENAGADNERQLPLAAGVEHMDLDPAQHRVYFTRNAQPGLFERDLAGGGERLVTPAIDTSLGDGWRVVDGRIWYVSKVAWKPTDILEFDPATGNQRVVGHLQTELRDVRFSPTPKRDRIALVPLSVEDTDIGAFELTRND